MDKILLQQKIAEWEKACHYFLQKEVQGMLSNEELAAIIFLIDFWREKDFDKEACTRHINTLKEGDKLHSAHREIIEKSKTLRGLAQTFYTTDEATFKEFRVAMGWKPTQAPVPNSTPQHDSNPNHDEALIMISIEKWTKAMQFLRSEAIIQFLDHSELTAIEQLGDMWRRTSYSPEMKEEAAEYIKVLVASHKLHSSNREIIEHSKNICAVARKIYESEQEFNNFKRHITQYYKNNRPPQRNNNPIPTPQQKPIPTHQKRDSEIIIKNVLFANRDTNGNIIHDFSSKLFKTSYYIVPRITVSSNYYGTQTITVIMNYSDGSSDRYDTEIEFSGTGDYELLGWGNDRGSAFGSYQYIDYSILVSGRRLWEGRLDIVRDPSLPTYPTVSNIKFAAVDYDGNIEIDYGQPIRTGISYLKPLITVSNNFHGTVTLELVFEYKDRETERVPYEISINGPGDYKLTGWGNRERTAYNRPETIIFTLKCNHRELYRTTVDIGMGRKRHYDNYNSNTSSGSGLTLWERYSNAIIRIGNWIASNADIITSGLQGLIGIIYIIAIIVAWIGEGFLEALLTGVIGFFIVGLLAIGIGFITPIVMFILRFIFYNGWTFLIAALFFFSPLFLTAYDGIGRIFNTEQENKYEIVQTAPEPVYDYYCTSKALNIRESPSSDSGIIGSYSKGDKIEVYNIDGDFACINYKGRKAYVSSKYISKNAITEEPSKPKKKEPVTETAKNTKQHNTGNDARTNDTNNGKTQQTAKEESRSESTIYNTVEVQPEFPGGTQAMMKYINDNIKYPTISRDAGSEGTSYVGFVINTDGSIQGVEIVKSSSDPYLNGEAIRIVKNMPKWNPGKQGGKPVRVRYTLPIRFKLK